VGKLFLCFYLLFFSLYSAQETQSLLTEQQRDRIGINSGNYQVSEKKETFVSRRGSDCLVCSLNCVFGCVLLWMRFKDQVYKREKKSLNKG
jgi:hypothetical protein